MEKITLNKETPASWKWRLTRLSKTQKQLAQDIGVSHVTINRCIKGKSLPTINVIIKIESEIRRLELAAGLK